MIVFDRQILYFSTKGTKINICWSRNDLSIILEVAVF